MANKVGIFSYGKANGKTTTCAYLASALSIVGKKVFVSDLSGSVQKLIASHDFKQGYGWEISDSFDAEDKGMDYVLVDLPSSEAFKPDQILPNLDSVIIPIEADLYGLENLNKTLQVVNTFENLLIQGFLFTKCNSNSTYHETMESSVARYFPELIFKSKIYRNYYLSLPQFSLHTINEHPFHGGFIDYLKLANEIIDNEC
jgi:cellulose biosynthesis protein BcsQ